MDEGEVIVRLWRFCRNRSIAQFHENQDAIKHEAAA